MRRRCWLLCDPQGAPWQACYWLGQARQTLGAGGASCALTACSLAGDERGLSTCKLLVVRKGQPAGHAMHDGV